MSIEGNGFEDGLSTKIIDHQGRIIQKTDRVPIQDDLLIDISRQPNGVYILKATRHNATFRKMLIQTAR